MDQMTPLILAEMAPDSENDSEELVKCYDGASPEQRAALNDLCIFLCGRTLEPILESCGFTGERELKCLRRLARD